VRPSRRATVGCQPVTAVNLADDEEKLPMSMAFLSAGHSRNDMLP
jgi:hypothetical protein